MVLTTNDNWIYSILPTLHLQLPRSECSQQGREKFRNILTPDIFRGKINFLTKLLDSRPRTWPCMYVCTCTCELQWKINFILENVNSCWELIRWIADEICPGPGERGLMWWVNNVLDHPSHQQHQHCFPASHSQSQSLWSMLGWWQQWCVDKPVTGDQDTTQGGELRYPTALICTFQSNVRLFCSFRIIRGSSRRTVWNLSV